MTAPPRVGAITRTGLLALAFLLVATPPALADDARAAAAKRKQAARLIADGDYAEAATVIDEGLALAPGNLQLLQLRGSARLGMRDFEGALAAYEAFIAAGPRSANKRAAQRIVANLQAVRTTRLALTITGATADDAATVYLDSKSLGVFCTAAPVCERGLLPGEYKLVVERPGHKKLTERVTIEAGKTATVERALVEEPSQLTVTVAAATATPAPPSIVVLDGTELGAAPQTATVPAGEHTLELRTPGHVTERQTFVATRAQPVELAVTLRRLVPITVNAPGAEVLLGDAPAPREADALALPAGAVTLEVRAAGHRPATVEVPAARGDDYRLDVELAKAPAPLSVSGAPRGARVVVDGRVVGTLPLAAPIDLEQGDRTVEVTAPRRATFRTRVAVGSDAPLQLDVADMPSTNRRWVWIAAAGTGAALVSWGAFGALALREQSRFDDRAAEAGVTPMDPALTDAEDAGARYARFSDVSMALTLVGAGAVTWLYLKEGRGQSRGEITPVIAPGAVGVQGAF